jgi:hypothetical protein
MNEDQNLGEIAEHLKRLRPAPATVDANVLFYNAGYKACQSELSAPGRLRIAPLIAAGLLAAIVTAPASYRVGRTAALRPEPVTQEAVAVAETTTTEPATRQQAPTLEPVLDENVPSSREQKTQLFARWIDPYRALTESAFLNKEPGTTLAVFHSSLVSQQHVDQLSIDFPFASKRPSYGDLTGTELHGRSDVVSPLAASDLSQLAQSLEASR